MENLVAAPVLIPLATAVAILPVAERWQRVGAAIGGLASLAAAVALLARVWDGAILVLPLGGWGPGVGIVWVVDGTSALLLVAAAAVGLAAQACLSAGWIGDAPPRVIHPLAQLLSMGVHGALVTGDFFNLFVFFEVLLFASFALIVTGGGEGTFRRTFPYVVVSLVASLLFLAAVGTIYGLAGTVNMAELSRRLAVEPASAPLRTALGLMLAAFAVKAGLVPFFVWLPDSYPAAPLTVTALFAGLLTKVGVYALFRATPLLFPPGDAVYGVLAAVGVATMVVGVLGALGRSTLRGILSFHVVSQVGYLVFGLGVGAPAALGAALLFTAHNMVVKPALILAGGIAERQAGTGELKQQRGLAGRPWAAAAFFVPALALAGIPPLSGFWAKFLLIRAGFSAGASAGSAVAIAVSLLTLASMLKIWNAVGWHGREAAPPLGAPERRLLASALGLSALAVGLGLLAGPLAEFTRAAAAQALAVRPYVDAVLGGNR